MSEVRHFAAQEVTTAKSVQTPPPLTQKPQNLSRFGKHYLKELFKRSTTKEMGLIKAF